jgi:hypothetical protein
MSGPPLAIRNIYYAKKKKMSELKISKSEQTSQPFPLESLGKPGIKQIPESHPDLLSQMSRGDSGGSSNEGKA